MNAFTIFNAKLVLQDKVVEGLLEVREGRIQRVASGSGKGAGQPAAGSEAIDARGGFVTPGFIDTHLHGGGGFFVAEEGTADSLRAAVKSHWSHGTTTLYMAAATMRAEQERTFLEAFTAVHRDPEYADSIPGVHMEGPYLSQVKAGAHAHDLLRMANLKELDQWQAWSGDGVRLITVAFEADPGLEFMRAATQRGIRILLGHTDCTYEQALQAFAAGANRVTHLFNAMSPLHQRKPGMVGAALSEDGAWIELICDGHHIHPAVMKIVARCKPRSRLIAVTDCLTDYQAGKDVKLTIGGAAVHYESKGFFALDNGTMAGSALTMEKAVANLTRMTELSLPDAVNCATLNPAADLGLQQRKGSLEPGKDADLVMLDADWNVRQTFVRGRSVFKA